MVFIISDAYNLAKYAERSQQFFVERATIARIDFCSEIPLFEAGVTNTIVHFAKLPPSDEHTPVRASRSGERAVEFDSHVEVLPSSTQSGSGVELFRPTIPAARRELQASTMLGQICYISYGLRANADDRYWPGAFTTDDCLSPEQDAIHSKPFVQGKDLERWCAKRTSYLEWGTTRALDRFSRPTFRELHEVREKLIAVRTPGRTPKVIYDDKGLHFDASCVGFVPWHHLRGAQSIDSQVCQISVRSPARAQVAQRISRGSGSSISEI